MKYISHIIPRKPRHVKGKPRFVRLQNVYIPVMIYPHFSVNLKTEQARIVFHVAPLFFLSFTLKQQAPPELRRRLLFYFIIRCASARFISRLREEDCASFSVNTFVFRERRACR